MTQRVFLLALLLGVLGVVFAFSSKDTNTQKHVDTRVMRIVDTLGCKQGKYKIYNAQIKILKYEDFPYYKGNKTVPEVQYADAQSVPLHSYKGKLNYHPVHLAQRALSLLDVYNTTRADKSLDTAQKIAKKLFHLSMEFKSADFFPYTFDFPLHGYKEETMFSPWYSAMAQGQILSLFVRLYEITHDNFYLEVSGKIFNSFNLSHYNVDGMPWVTCVDENGYLWLEEYPRLQPAYTLNGMIFALFGVYDYYRITKNPMAENTLRGAILTIKENIDKFRVENAISHYCLRHPMVRSLKYHKIHIWQLKELYKITGDSVFLESAKSFAADTRSIQ